MKDNAQIKKDSRSSNISSEGKVNNSELKSKDDADSRDGRSDNSYRNSASKENISIAYIIAEVKATLKAEKEMIAMLLDTIAQRRRDNVFYDIS